MGDKLAGNVEIAYENIEIAVPESWIFSVNRIDDRFDAISLYGRNRSLHQHDRVFRGSVLGIGFHGTQSQNRPGNQICDPTHFLTPYLRPLIFPVIERPPFQVG
jgi:hypothetical protein